MMNKVGLRFSKFDVRDLDHSAYADNAEPTLARLGWQNQSTISFGDNTQHDKPCTIMDNLASLLGGAASIPASGKGGAVKGTPKGTPAPK
jgi:hypothetical protein